MPGRPTPTQDELNKLAKGEPVEFSDDGSGPDPNIPEAVKEGVQRKQAQAEHTTPPRTTSRSSA